MNNKRSLLWFLSISFIFSWILFLIPLTIKDNEPTKTQLLTQGLWAIAMWGPGLAAIVTTTVVDKQSLKSLNLNKLGQKKFYLWAWLLPAFLTLLSGLFTLLFGIAEVDLNFSVIQNALATTSNGDVVPASVVVLSQVILALTLAPLINIVFAMGEELGWRGYLLPKLLHLGQWQAVLLSGLIWGIWHIPAIAQGHNYPGYPVLGSFMMIVFCILLGIILSWLTLNTQSPWVAALAHGSVNAVAGLPVLFFKPEFNMAMGGTLAAPTAWIGMVLFIAWLMATKRFPVNIPSKIDETQK